MREPNVTKILRGGELTAYIEKVGGASIEVIAREIVQGTRSQRAWATRLGVSRNAIRKRVETFYPDHKPAQQVEQNIRIRKVVEDIGAFNEFQKGISEHEAILSRALGTSTGEVGEVLTWLAGQNITDRKIAESYKVSLGAVERLKRRLLGL